MVRRLAWLAVIALLWTSARSSNAGTSSEFDDGWASRAAFSLFVDQDVFFGPAFDQDFSMGVVATWAGGWVKESWVTKPLNALDGIPLLKKASGFIPPGLGRPSDYIEVWSFSAGDSAFTPAKANLFRDNPLPYDRPYSNLLFVSVKREHSALYSNQKTNRLEPGKRAYTSDLTVGILGLRIGKAAQTWIHTHISDDVLPKGWNHQISDGGEPTAMYRTAQKWLLWDRPAVGTTGEWYNERQSDGQFFLEESLGLPYSNVSAGAKLRFGKINSAWWTGDRMPNAATRAPMESEYAGSELFIHLSVAGTTWAYNSLLQGQLRDTDVRLSFKDRGPGFATLKRFTADTQGGVTWRRNDFTLSYQITFVSPAFGGRGVTGEKLERGHNWGGIYLTWRR